MPIKLTHAHTQIDVEMEKFKTFQAATLHNSLYEKWKMQFTHFNPNSYVYQTRQNKITSEPFRFALIKFG